MPHNCNTTQCLCHTIMHKPATQLCTSCHTMEEKPRARDCVARSHRWDHSTQIPQMGPGTLTQQRSQHDPTDGTLTAMPHISTQLNKDLRNLELDHCHNSTHHSSAQSSHLKWTQSQFPCFKSSKQLKLNSDFTCSSSLNLYFHMILVF